MIRRLGPRLGGPLPFRVADSLILRAWGLHSLQCWISFFFLFLFDSGILEDLNIFRVF